MEEGIILVKEWQGLGTIGNIIVLSLLVSAFIGIIVSIYIDRPAEALVFAIIFVISLVIGLVSILNNGRLDVVLTETVDMEKFLENWEIISSSGLLLTIKKRE